jgi:hypothetical protein
VLQAASHHLHISFKIVLRCLALGQKVRKEEAGKRCDNHAVNHIQGLKCSFLLAITVALALKVPKVLLYLLLLEAQMKN